jgi:hypothetical protein
MDQQWHTLALQNRCSRSRNGLWASQAVVFALSFVRLQAGHSSASHISHMVRLEALRTVIYHPHRRVELDLWQQDTSAVTEGQGQAPTRGNGARCRNMARAKQQRYAPTHWWHVRSITGRCVSCTKSTPMTEARCPMRFCHTAHMQHIKRHTAEHRTTAIVVLCNLINPTQAQISSSCDSLLPAACTHHTSERKTLGRYEPCAPGLPGHPWI